MDRNVQLKGIAKDSWFPKTTSDQVVMPDGKTLSDSLDNASSMWAFAAGKRLSMLRDTRWYPQGTIPRAMDGTDYFVKGNEYRGIPYSSTREIDKYVGYNVSLRTFLTAVHNKYSLLYTENINADHSKSSWGKTYHGTECGPYIGMQCTSFVDYVVGLSVYWLTHEYNYAEKMGYIIKKGRVTSAKVALFDIILSSGHDRIVSAITYNTDGTIASIEVSDSTAPTIGIHTYTPAAFDSTFNNGSYTLYRVANNSDLSFEYEDVSDLVYNDDICTILGDYAAFRKGDTIAVSYTKGDYTSMELYKDGTLLYSRELSADGHYIDFTADNLARGFYKARLTDGVNNSEFTYFEVIEATITCSVVDGKCKVEFASGNARAVYVDFCTQIGDVVARWKFTGPELLAGEAVIDVTQLNTYQPRYSVSGCYCKVLFKGEYGMIQSAMVASGL